MAQNGTQKLKILALHGYMQSAEKFKEKNPLPRKFKKITDFVFITAPFAIPLIDEDIGSTKNVETDNGKLPKEPNLIEHPITDVTGSFMFKEEPVEPTDYPTKDTDSFAWYLRRPNETKTGHYYRGLKECIEFLEDVFKEKGSFDGIFGFSQGACVVAMLCALQQKKLTKNIKFDFAIMAGAYKFVANEFYDEILKVPSLHIFGEADQWVVPDRSRGLADCFENPLIVSHSGGHFVPCNALQKSMYEPFFTDQWKRKFGSNEGQTSIS